MKLSIALTAYQQKLDLTSKALAEEIGISESGLCRIKADKSPDALGFVKIMAWLTTE